MHISKKHLTAFLLVFFFLLFGSPIAQIQLVDEKRFAFDPQLDYDASIPSPKQVLGYPLGHSFTVYESVVDYLEQLSAKSPKVLLNEYGKTYEGRRLINLVITSEENHKNLEAIRQRHLELLDPNCAEADQYIKSEPVFTSLSYNIHGNEASCSEAAMQVAYRLAAAQDEETANILENSVIILYICINPDGRDRYVYWYKSSKRSIYGIEPGDLEHYAPWPNGRTNHYWFDLNRDWIWGVHPESRGHTAEYQKWMPQTHVDYHEMGYQNNYFTMPGTTPRNKLLPDHYEALSDTFGLANIAAFNQHQLSYYTRESFDFFYPGYGSSYPSVLGAIGMLTEQGGIGAGLAVKTNDDYILTLRQKVFDHYTTSVATIRKAVDRKEQLLRYSFDSWNPKNSKSQNKAYLFPDNPNSYLYDVLQILDRQGVEIQKTIAPVSIEVKDYKTGALSKKQFPKGTFLISTNQSRHLFINSILQRDMEIEDSVMYDMATWSAPLAYNLEAYSTVSNASIRGDKVEKIPDYPHGVINAGASYAYIIDWKQRFAPKALALLWKKGYRVRAAREAFVDGKNEFSEGTLLVLIGRNLKKKDVIEKEIAEIATQAQVQIRGYNTGRMMKGMDFGAPTNLPVKQPKVALMVDQPFSTYTAGQIFFLFDQETQLPVQRIKPSVLSQTDLPKFGQRYGYVDLNDFDVLILPGGGTHLKKVFQKEGLEKLKAWVTAGGVLIAAESAASFFTADQSKLTKIKLKELKKDSSEAAIYLKYGDREDFIGKKNIPGSALNAQIDPTHPLAFGMPKDLYSLKFGKTALIPDPDFYSVGYYEKEVEGLLAAGYASKENLKHLAGNTFAGVKNIGKGKIVFLIDNTQYRMFWRGPSRMMQNAVMLMSRF